MTEVINKLTEKEDIINLIQKIKDDNFNSEKESDQAIILLEQSVIDPNVTEIIFWSKEEMTAEEIYEKAISYKPIVLGSDS